MRAWLMIGTMVVGVLVFAYEWYSTREHDHYEGPHGPGGRGGGPSMSEDDFIEINTTSPKELERRLGRDVKVPGQDEVCSICLEPLTSMRTKEMKKYIILSLPRCGHWFHKSCAFRLLEYHPYCPVCRVEIDGSSLRGTPVRVLQPPEDIASTSSSSSSADEGGDRKDQ